MTKSNAIHTECGHPWHVHGKDPRSIGCPQPQYRFTFQIGDEQIHESVLTVALARLTARSLATSRHATVRIFKHGPRVPYGWEVAG